MGYESNDVVIAESEIHRGDLRPSAPHAAPPQAQAAPKLPRFEPLFAAIGGAVVIWVISFALAAAGLRLLPLIGIGIGALTMGLAFLWSMVTFARALWVSAPVPGRVYAGILAAWVMSFFGFLVCLAMTGAFGRGRQLRIRGKILLPKVEEGPAWTRVALATRVPDRATRSGLAAQWRENGRTEHASVAAFAHVALDLMTLGAPPQLLATTNQDALDEIRHAQLCFSLARSLDGREESPSDFRQARASARVISSRRWALARLAVEALVEGALLEGFSARLIAQMVRVCEDPATRGVLVELAADEGRHSKHGWDVVEWCLSEGGEPVAHALRGALAALPSAVTTTLPAEARSGAWERYGIPSAEREAEAYRLTLEQLSRRLADGLNGAVIAA